MLQIQHQPQPQVQTTQTGPSQNPLLFLTQQQPSSPSPTSVFVPSSMFDTPTQPTLPPQQASTCLQHCPWHQSLETPYSSCSSSSSTCYTSSLSPVASAAYLLEARLHISQQPHPQPSYTRPQQPQSATQAPTLSKLTVWSRVSAPGADPSLQELGLAGQQQLSSCVMVK